LLSFDPKREPAVPRHAATVVVVRDGAQGLEVFCVLRHQKSSFLGGAVVFPGGKVEEADGADVWTSLATEPHPRGTEMCDVGPSVRAVAVAACREALEEGNIVPLVRAEAPAEVVGDADVDALRREAGGFTSHPPGFAEAIARRGLRLALHSLVPWARWVTPEAESRRYDARFFLLELPLGQVGRHDEHETTMSFWARPSNVLSRFSRGEIFLAPPTTRTLEVLAAAADVRAALGLAAEQSLRPICPQFVPDDTAPFLALPGDPAHAVRERRVAGGTRFVLRDGRFVSEDPPGAAEGGETTGGRATT
jgi:8-oxo-dGTP pyrophosphatase MutT (NUDIX family)